MTDFGTRLAREWADAKCADKIVGFLFGAQFSEADDKQAAKRISPIIAAALSQARREGAAARDREWMTSLGMDGALVGPDDGAHAMSMLRDLAAKGAAALERVAIGDGIGIKVDPEDEFDRGYNAAKREILLSLRARAGGWGGQLRACASAEEESNAE
jgi:hypothetical protein